MSFFFGVRSTKVGTWKTPAEYGVFNSASARNFGARSTSQNGAERRGVHFRTPYSENLLRVKAVARRFDFCGDFLRRPDGDENSEKLSPPSRNLLRGSSAKSPPIQRRCYGDRGREIWDERHSANFGGGRFGSPKKRRRFQGSSASPQNLRQTLQTRIT